MPITVTPSVANAKPAVGESPRSIKVMSNHTPMPRAQLGEAPAPTGPEGAAMAPKADGEVQSDNAEADSEAKPLSPQYAALARKEQALRTKEKEIQAQSAAIEDRIKTAVDEALKGYKSRLKEDTFGVLGEEGLTYDQLVELQLNQPNPEFKALKQEVDELKKGVSKRDEEYKTREQAQREAAIKQIESDAGELIESDPEYATIKEAGSIKEVVDLIVNTFDTEGKLMTVEQAAKQIEDKLLAEANKYLGFSKIKSKIPQLTPEAVEASKTEKPADQGIKTLTNSMTSTKQYTARERAMFAAQYGPNWREKIK